MSFLNSCFISIFYKKIGEDNFGNKYYEGRKKDILGLNRRFVIYKGKAEPSKVPPLWHSWLHHLSDEIPMVLKNFNWQKDYLPNLTGTKFSYDPSKKSDYKNEFTYYNKWQPK